MDWHFILMIACLPIIGFCLGSLIFNNYWRERFEELSSRINAIDGAFQQLTNLHIDNSVKLFQAYQVIGACRHYAEEGNKPKCWEGEIERALDYFADIESVDPNFLPWPREMH